tara:strand:- start:9496 stop:9672 length:177 start_codon:yes stop_codon:yes gene_type:complete
MTDKKKVTYGFSFRYGLLFWRVIDEPNEADIVIITIWGIGHYGFFGFVWPWRPLRIDF